MGIWECEAGFYTYTFIHCQGYTEPPAAPTLILYLFCLPFSLFVCNKSGACIAAEPREAVDDGRALSTCGFEEAAVMLYPVNSEYIVLKGVAKQPQGNEWDSNSGDLELHWCFVAHIVHNSCNIFWIVQS